MEQRLDRAHARIGVETALDTVAVEEIGQRQQTHALMMGHVGAHDHAALALAGAGGG